MHCIAAVTRTGAETDDDCVNILWVGRPSTEHNSHADACCVRPRLWSSHDSTAIVL